MYGKYGKTFTLGVKVPADGRRREERGGGGREGRALANGM